MNGKIITLEPKAAQVFGKDFTTLMQVITDIYSKEEEK